MATPSARVVPVARMSIGVGDGGTPEELRLDLLGAVSFELGHIESRLRQSVGEHHARASGMGHDGEVLAR